MKTEKLATLERLTGSGRGAGGAHIKDARQPDPVGDLIYATLNDRANYAKITPYGINIFSVKKQVKSSYTEPDPFQSANKASDSAAERSLDISTKRTKQTVRELFLSNKRRLLNTRQYRGTRYTPAFITLTFKPSIDIQPDYALAEFGRFARKLKRQFGSDVSYVSVVEIHKSGRPHIHAVVSGIPQIVFQKERETRQLADLWQNGFVDVKLISKPSLAVGMYIAKYISKDFVAVSQGKKRYVASRNLDYPIKHFVHNGNLDDFINFILNYNYSLSTVDTLHSPYFGDYIKVQLTKINYAT